MLAILQKVSFLSVLPRSVATFWGASLDEKSWNSERRSFPSSDSFRTGWGTGLLYQCVSSWKMETLTVIKGRCYPTCIQQLVTGRRPAESTAEISGAIDASQKDPPPPPPPPISMAAVRCSLTVWKLESWIRRHKKQLSTRFFYSLRGQLVCLNGEHL